MKCFGGSVSDWNYLVLRINPAEFGTWQACCGSSAAAVRTRLVFWAGQRPPSVAGNQQKS